MERQLSTAQHSSRAEFEFEMRDLTSESDEVSILKLPRDVGEHLAQMAAVPSHVRSIGATKVCQEDFSIRLELERCVPPREQERDLLCIIIRMSISIIAIDQMFSQLTSVLSSLMSDSDSLPTLTSPLFARPTKSYASAGSAKDRSIIEDETVC